MFVINTETKKSVKIERVTFAEIGLKERRDLQEWIDNEPSILGEYLLIIQKEFEKHKIIIPSNMKYSFTIFKSK